MTSNDNGKINLDDKKTRRIIWELEDEILELIDNRDEYTRSDLQGGVAATVKKILRVGHKLGS